MSDKEFLTVKEFAEAANVSTQYIYKILGSQLKPYKKKQNKKTVIDKAALKIFENEVATDATDAIVAPTIALFVKNDLISSDDGTVWYEPVHGWQLLSIYTYAGSSAATFPFSRKVAGTGITFDACSITFAQSPL